MNDVPLSDNDTTEVLITLTVFSSYLQAFIPLTSVFTHHRAGLVLNRLPGHFTNIRVCIFKPKKAM